MAPMSGPGRCGPARDAPSARTSGALGPGAAGSPHVQGRGPAPRRALGSASGSGGGGGEAEGCGGRAGPGGEWAWARTRARAGGQLLGKASEAQLGEAPLGSIRFDQARLRAPSGGRGSGCRGAAPRRYRRAPRAWALPPRGRTPPRPPLPWCGSPGGPTRPSAQPGPAVSSVTEPGTGARCTARCLNRRRARRERVGGDTEKASPSPDWLPAFRPRLPSAPRCGHPVGVATRGG